MTVTLTPTTDSIVASWHAPMGLHEALPGRWTVVDGQMVDGARVTRGRIVRALATSLRSPRRASISSGP